MEITLKDTMGVHRIYLEQIVHKYISQINNEADTAGIDPVKYSCACEFEDQVVRRFQKAREDRLEQLRDEYGKLTGDAKDACAKKGVDLSNCWGSDDEFVKLLIPCMQKSARSQGIYTCDAKWFERMSKNCISQVNDELGIDENTEVKTESGRSVLVVEPKKNGNWYPVSPFDSRFRSKMSVRNLGMNTGHIGVASLRGCRMGDGLERRRPDTDAYVFTYSQLKKQERLGGELPADAKKSALVSVLDGSGVSVLAKRSGMINMNIWSDEIESEIKDNAKKIADAHPNDKIGAQRDYFTALRAQTQACVELIDYLIVDKGIEGKLRKSTRVAGNLVWSTTNPDLEITVFDPTNTRFGQIYNKRTGIITNQRENIKYICREDGTLCNNEADVKRLLNDLNVEYRREEAAGGASNRYKELMRYGRTSKGKFSAFAYLAKADKHHAFVPAYAFEEEPFGTRVEKLTDKYISLFAITTGSDLSNFHSGDISAKLNSRRTKGVAKLTTSLNLGCAKRPYVTDSGSIYYRDDPQDDNSWANKPVLGNVETDIRGHSWDKSRRYEWISPNNARADKELARMVSSARANFINECMTVSNKGVRIDLKDEVRAFSDKIKSSNDDAKKEQRRVLKSMLSDNAVVSALQKKYVDVLTDDENVDAIEVDGVRVKRSEGESIDALIDKHLLEYVNQKIGTFDINSDSKEISFSMAAVLGWSDDVGTTFITNGTATDRSAKLVALCRRVGLTIPQTSSFVQDVGGSADDVEDEEEENVDEQTDEQIGLFSDSANEELLNRLVKFDNSTAKPISTYINNQKGRSRADWRQIRNALFTEFKQLGINVDAADLKVDATGRIQYSGTINRAAIYGSIAQEKLVGEIGPIFTPRESGWVDIVSDCGVTKTYAPLIEATIAPADKVSGDFYDRIRCREYMARLTDRVTEQVYADVLENMYDKDSETNRVGSCNSMFAFYKSDSTDCDRHVLGWEKEYIENGYPEEILKARCVTDAKLVKFNKTLRLEDAANIHAVFDNDPVNDMDFTGFNRIGHSIDEIHTNRYFSQNLTPVTSKQGSTLALGRDCSIKDHKAYAPLRVKTKAVTDAKCAVIDYCWGGKDYSEFDQANRSQMGENIVQHSVGLTRDVNVAYTTLGGWEQEDAIVVSSDFARAHKIRAAVRDENGVIIDHEYRELMIGDKLDNLHGNKGVISCIVDRDMTENRASAKRQLSAWALFKENPDLDIVMSPNSFTSRNNAGIYVEAKDKGTDVLRKPIVEVEKLGTGYIPSLVKDKDGRAKCENVDGGMSKTCIAITDKDAVGKSIVYTDTSPRHRRVSWQVINALSAQGADGILHYLFKNNGAARDCLQDHLRCIGMDLLDDNTLTDEISDEHDSERLKFNENGFVQCVDSNGRECSRDIDQASAEIKNKIAKSGGLLYLPFSLEYPSRPSFEMENEGKFVIDWSKDYEEKKLKSVGACESRPEVEMYVLPVMDISLRQEMGEGMSGGIVNKYTAQYMGIVDAMETWYRCQDKIDSGKFKGDKLEALKAEQGVAQKLAQRDYDTLSKSVLYGELTGHKNDFYKLQSANVPHGATVIWSGDPSLDVDEVALNEETRKKLGVWEGDYVCLWRDPVLNTNCLRALKVVSDENVAGCAVHPGIAKTIGGDYDGDTVGIMALPNEELEQEAKDKLSIDANLLDLNAVGREVVDDCGVTRVKYPINFECGLDASVGMSFDTDVSRELKERLDKLETDINKFELWGGRDGLSKDEIAEVRHGFVCELDCVLDGANIMSGYATKENPMVIQMHDDAAHLRSIKKACIDTGAKGSVSKVCGSVSNIDTPGTYAHYMGCTMEFEQDEDGKVVDFKDASVQTICDKSGARAQTKTEEDVVNCHRAADAKNNMTGIAGNVAKYMYNVCTSPRSRQLVGKISSAIYQKTLDWKHDGVTAYAEAEIVKNVVPKLMRGYVLDGGIKVNQENGKLNFDYKFKMNEKGGISRCYQNTISEWVDSVCETYHVLGMIDENDKKLFKADLDEWARDVSAFNQELESKYVPMFDMKDFGECLRKDAVSTLNFQTGLSTDALFVAARNQYNLNDGDLATQIATTSKMFSGFWKGVTPKTYEIADNVSAPVVETTVARNKEQEAERRAQKSARIRAMVRQAIEQMDWCPPDMANKQPMEQKVEGLSC